MQKEKIVFLSSSDPSDRKSWSGISYFLYSRLAESYDIDIVVLPKLRALKLIGYYFSKIFSAVVNGKYVFDYGLIISFLFGVVGSFMLRKFPDRRFIFCPAGLTEIAFVKTGLPIVTYGDCSTLQMIDYYPALQNVCSLSKSEIKAVERRALTRASIRIFSSDWAGNFVKSVFGLACDVIPFGANFNGDSAANQTKSLASGKCELLFIGVDWIRKGGDIALKIHERLLDRGVDSYLTIVGCSPTNDMPLPRNVEVHPFIDKNTAAGELQLRSIFQSAHFLLLPTKADCTPIVIAEAFSFGLPVLATDTGGISSMITNDVTGKLLPDGHIDGYVSFILSLCKNGAGYSQMSENCLINSEQIFNWRSWGDNFQTVINNELKLRR